MSLYEFNMAVAVTRCMLLVGVLQGFSLHMAVVMVVEAHKHLTED